MSSLKANAPAEPQTRPLSLSTQRARKVGQIKRILWAILGLNLGVAVAKVGVGLFTGSISMVADGFHSTLDASSNVIGLLGLAVAARPPDVDHPYGHQKYETFATLAIGMLLLVASWNVLKSAVSRLGTGSAPEVTPLSLAVMIVTIGLNWLVTVYESRRGRELGSSLLLADAAHTRSDIFVSLSVVAGLVAVRLGWRWMDAVVALAIVVFIAYTGLQIIRRASDVLADSTAIDPKLVEQVVMSVDEVESCHKIRSRGTPQAIHLDLHIQVDGRMSLERAHEIGHEVQARLTQELAATDVVVHVEPVEMR